MAEGEQRLTDLRSPSLLAPRQMERRDPRQPQRIIRRRQRLLRRPVMVALIVSLVWRRMPAGAEGHKVLSQEGVWWVTPLRVSPQALPNRLDARPAAVMGPLVAEVWGRLQAHAPPPRPPPSWAPGCESVPRSALVDGSTLEARRNKTRVLRKCAGLVLGGTMLVMGEAFSQRPLGPLQTEDAAANDQRCATEMMAAVPVGGWLVCDLGFFSLLWFDDCTASQPVWVTRRREKTASRTVRERSRSPGYGDEIIAVGQQRSNPCRYPLRLGSVWWQGQGDRDLPKVLDPQVLSARQVCEWSRRRWRMAEAFVLTTRVLDLAYGWTGSINAVQWQISATLIGYAVLLTLCQQVAEVLGEPWERISVERVCRACYHESRALQRGACHDLVTCLAEQAKLLGIVKRWRTQNRERQELEAIMWGDP